MKTGKVWGTTELLLREPSIEIHRLVIRSHAKCSIHLHQHKYNAFLVIRGKLNISVRKNDYRLTDVTTLGPGELMTVRPNEQHWFWTAGKGAVAIEIYYLPSLSEDIIRTTVGSARKGK